MLIYTKQKNLCLWLLRKGKREYFANLKEKDINYNRFCILSNLSSPIELGLEKINFWKTNLHFHLRKFTFL